MPGTTFSDIIKRNGYDSVKNACIPFSLLKQLLYKIFIDLEAQRYSDKLLATRIEAWKADKFSPRVPNNALDLVVFLGQVFGRVVSVKGIEYEDITYFSDELASMRCALPEEQWKVKCKGDPSDMGRIWVLDPRSESFFEVPAVHQDYAVGLSLWNHKVIKRYARKHKGTKSHANLVDAKADLRRMVEERAIKSKRKRSESPQKVTRFLSGDAPSATLEDAQKPLEPAHDAARDPVEAATNTENASAVGATDQDNNGQSAKPHKSPSTKQEAAEPPLSGAPAAPTSADEFDDEFNEFEVEVG